VLFKKNCVQCHGPEAKGGTPNPGSSEGHVPSLNPIDEGLLDSDPAVFAENIDRFIQHGSVPPGTNPALHMPAFGDTSSLTQQEISNIEAYVMSLNGIDRAKLMHPGLMPRQFLLIVAGIFALTALFLGGIRSKRKRRG
jgi:mono/diheme cytochrome c family protein